MLRRHVDAPVLDARCRHAECERPVTRAAIPLPVSRRLPLSLVQTQDRRACTTEPSGTNSGCGGVGEHPDPAFPVRKAAHCYPCQSATEVSMSSVDASSNSSTQMPAVGTTDMKLEVVTLPVSDVDRAKRFYQSLGWRTDADIVVGENFRVVQLTPPHSACSISFGKGLTTAEPGSAQRLLLVVYDIDAARAELISRGVEASEVFHLAGGRVPGPDPQRRSYQTYVSFSDPDGNAWLLQEIRTRLPGREWEDLTGDVASWASLLKETAQHHDP